MNIELLTQSTANSHRIYVTVEEAYILRNTKLGFPESILYLNDIREST